MSHVTATHSPHSPTHSMPTKCPVTGDALEITRLECPTSGITIEGRFKPNEFALLPGEQLEFLRLFVRVRGNLKEIERIMGLSYPTIRLRFETLLQTLGYEAAPDTEASEDRASILEKLEKGEINAEEAARQLKLVNISLKKR